MTDALTLDSVNAELTLLKNDVNTEWQILCGAIVFFMQAGFAMLESGTVREKNTHNILFKNMTDAVIGTLGWWLIGYAFAFGDENDGGFIGLASFALHKTDNFSFWFFQWAFAATTATIVSGSVAERCHLHSYFIYCLLQTIWIYPVVVHWVWDDQGWLCAWGPNLLFGTGFLDFAGSGVVHTVGGVAGFVGAVMLGPRIGRFSDDPEKEREEFEPSSITFCGLGTLILWFGWYGFNCGSTLGVSGQMATASLVATTTTIAASTGCLTTALMSRIFDSHFDVSLTFNGILAGLVAITAGCNCMQPWAAFVTGLIGGMVYYGFHRLLLALKIDDPLDASSVHGACGIWGVLAVGFFSDPALSGVESRGYLIASQVVGILTIVSWTALNSLLVFIVLKYTVGIRVESADEIAGLDASEHTNLVEMSKISKKSARKPKGSEDIDSEPEDSMISKSGFRNGFHSNV